MTVKVEAVQKMQDYIAAHVAEEITLSALADVACFSPWYCYRIFKELTGLSVSDYVRRLKLTGAAKALSGQKNDLQGDNEKMETKNIFIQLIKKPARKVLIKRAQTATEYFKYCEEVGCDVWGILTSMDSLCGEPVCLWLPEKLRAGKSEYVQGVEVPVDYAGVIPDGFDVIELPECDYLMFQGEPFNEEDYEDAIGAMWDAEKKYDPSVIGVKWDKENPRIQLEPRGERGYIELLPVK